MIRDLIFLGSGLVAATLFMIVKNLVTKQAKEVTTEAFNIKKFSTGMLNVGSAVDWAKDIASLFNIRKLIIIGIIIGAIYGYGWYKGKQGVQPILDWRGKEEWVSLNDHYLHVNKNGTMEVVAADKKTVLKKITVKDVENLKKNLQPYGFIFKPIMVLGIGVGDSRVSKSSIAGEVGIGAQWLKYYKWVADACLTTAGIYPLGVSYQITENSFAGISAGIGYKGDKRVLFKWSWRF